MLNLTTLTMSTLVSMINELGGVATMKTFSQRSKAIARLEKIAADKGVDLNTVFDETGAKIVAKAPKAGKSITIRSVAEALLLQVITVGEKQVGLSYDEVLTAIKAQFPTAKTTAGCLRWYAVRMRERNVATPARPRTTAPKAAA